mmetsp:Transcript_27564/g.45401  ORF Transcript_27564/g.45401 Transcript_27564/m.45401 type:complete len:109 (+) Transcript_27564:7-333(+)
MRGALNDKLRNLVLFLLCFLFYQFYRKRNMRSQFYDLLAFLCVLFMVIFSVNGCGRPCSNNGDCKQISKDTDLCCNSCCPGNADCSIVDPDTGIIIDYSEPNICGNCK